MIREWIDSLLGYKDLYLAEREWSTALNEKLLEVEKEKATLEPRLKYHLNKFSCSTTLSLREKLSSEAFASTGSYDATISNFCLLYTSDDADE